MSEVLTVPTAFGDISDLTEGLVDRVDGDQIILYGPDPYEEGAEIGFSVLLLDGTPALEGRGRVEASVDGGEDRDPSTRYDIILGALELGGTAEAVYESMLMARASMLGAEEAPMEEAEAEEASAEEVPMEEAEAEEAPVDEAPVDEAEAEEAPAEEAFAEEAPVEEAPVEQAEAEEAPAEEAVAEESSAEALEAGAGDVPGEEAAFEAEATGTSGEEEAEAEEAADWGEAPDESEAGVDVETDEAAMSGEGAGALDEEGFEEESADEEEPPVAPAIAIPTELFPAEDEHRGVAPPEAPSDPGGFAVTNDLTEGLVRPVQQNTWTPVAPERPEPRPSSGLFQYGASIPLPDAPPRPELDSSLVVTPAPRPGADEPEAVDGEVSEYGEPIEAEGVEALEGEVDVSDSEEATEAEAVEALEGEVDEPATGEAEAAGESGEYESAAAAGDDASDEAEVAEIGAEEVEAESDEVDEAELEYELEASERD